MQTLFRMVSFALVAVLGGKLSRAVFLAPTCITKILDAHSTYFKLSRCLGVSFINIIQVRLCRFLFRMVSYALVAELGGKLSRAVFLAPTCIIQILDAHSTYFKPSEC